MARQAPPFTLETVTDHHDTRTYGAVLVAEVRVEAGFEEAGTRGFKLLARYASSANQTRTSATRMSFDPPWIPSLKVGRATPVCQVQSPWGFMIPFVMPARFTLASLPKPDDARVLLREMPQCRLAVRRYSGFWTESLHHLHRRTLGAALKKDGVHTTGGPVFARFDSPFIPWFLRGNEILIEVAS